MDSKTKLGKARAGLILDHPFFGSLALRLTLVEDATNNPTAKTDGKQIRYNPEYIDGLELNETKGLLCHEVMHCANQHMTRRSGRDARRWNAACDFAINSIILDCGMSLPKGGLVDRSYADMSAEQIYGRLPDDPPGDGEGDDPGQCGGVEDAPSDGAGAISKEAASQLQQEWKIAIAQAAQQAKAMGSLPGSLDRFVDELVNPVLDWRELFRRFVDSAAKNDYQWCPPNRRYISAGWYLPSLRSTELKNVVCVLDTSGSITDSDLRMFEAEVKSIVEDYRTNATVIYCDNQVNGVEHFEEGDIVALKHRGGGGTDFRPPFDYLDSEGQVPACLVYQTDGYCYDFPTDPGYPVLWVITPGSSRSFQPPFGEVIFL
jgi:predicted metal-dependent peptidase